VTLEDRSLDALRTILEACAQECARSPLGNLLEGHLKVMAAQALLAGGYSILESANAKGLGRVLSLADGRVNMKLDARPLMAAAPESMRAKNSPDLRVWEPCRLIVELQVRSQFGSQSALFSDNLLDDVERVRRRSADAFVLAADRLLYDGLCGVKRDPRGRKAKRLAAIGAALPVCSSLGAGTEPRSWPVETRGDLLVTGTLLRGDYGVERCVIGVWRA
jgi:hypothetical protein